MVNGGKHGGLEDVVVGESMMVSEPCIVRCDDEGLWRMSVE